jgi:hypothetical protein
MANQVLGLGNAANDGAGDTLRVAADKINDNFSEIYTLIGDASSLSTGISATASVITLTAPLIATSISPSSADGATLGTASLEWSDIYLADSSIIYFGADQDVTLTHVADTGILINGASQLQFRDSALFINSSVDGQLDIAADTEVEITTALVEISADATIGDDLTLKSDAAVLGFGADTDVTLTHVADTGILLNSTSVIQFNDASQSIGAPNATTLDINATDEIELNATLVDVNGNLDVSGTIVSGGTLTATTSITIGSAVLTEAELELLDGITAGAGVANKVLVLDGSADVASGLRNLTASGTVQGTTITATTAFVPDASDGAALGTTALEFSDLFLADASTCC